MTMRRRLDAELVRRGLARSRDHARDLIESGAVQVQGTESTKVGRQVEESVSITLRDPDQSVWVSRGAHKLLGALHAFPDLAVRGRRALDAGASTGGFTQVLLSEGAGEVVAVDVGYGQLAWQLRTDPRVHVRERLNIRTIVASDLPYAPDLIVADLSFISLRTVIGPLTSIAATPCDFLLMVKPQFEVGREAVGQGVVSDPELHTSAVRDVISACHDCGLALRGVAASVLPGPKGNIEYFVWLSRGTDVPAVDVDVAVAQAVAGRPS
ncbi:MAG: TlyA family RNA methyltransferase [Actinobacteria bacterium]|nr:TlyA family RNA methyltransferase [Actinomycetota bacterium]